MPRPTTNTAATNVKLDVAGNEHAAVLAIHKATGVPLKRLAQEAFSAGLANVKARYASVVPAQP